MTITAQTSKTGPYSGNGTTTVFSYTFEVQDEAHLVVTLADAAGVETVQVLNTDYTVSGVGNANGGQITMSTAPASTYTLTISRNIPITQEVDLENRRSVAPEVLEDAYDKLTQIAQDLSEQLGRAIKISVTEGGNPTLTLEGDVQPGTFLGFDVAGNLAQLAPASGTFISPNAAIVAVDDFTGDGTTVNFTMGGIPQSPNNLFIFLDGVMQDAANYTVSGTTLTFTTAPPLNTNIEVRRLQAVALTGGTTADLVTYSPAGSGAVTRTVQSRLRDFVSVKDFGAVGDGVADDTAAIQAAIDAGRSVYFPDGTYAVSARLTASTPNVQIFGSGIIRPTAAWSGTGTTKSLLTIAIGASNVTVSGLTFDSDDTVIGSQINFQVESFAPNTMVTNCRFLNSVMIGGASGSCVAFRTTATYSQAIGNFTENTNGAIFVQGASCVVSGNICVDPNDVGIVLNGPQCVRCIVSNNVIDNASLNSLSGSILVEEASSQWVIEGNTIHGINNGIGIGAINVAVFTVVKSGKIIGNVINGGGGTTTNPCALISCNANYQDVEVSSNTLIGCPSGNAASRMLIFASAGGSIHDNIIDDEAGTIIAANVEIQAGARGVTIRNNISRARSGGRHFLFSAGDFSNVACQFIGGRLLGGSEGINTALSAPTNIQVWIDNILECTATNVVNMTAGMSWGERQTFLNVSGVEVAPLSIKQRTVMYGTAAPVAGTWVQGDTIFNLTPIGVSPPQGWMCSIGGTPGTWRAMASLI